MAKPFLPDEERILINDTATGQIVEIPVGMFSNWREALLGSKLNDDEHYQAWDENTLALLDLDREPVPGDNVAWRLIKDTASG